MRKTTFDEFTSDPEQKTLFEKEYAELCLSETLLEGMEKSKISVRQLAKKAGVSPSIVQKMRGENADRVTYRTLSNVLNTLGYAIRFEKLPARAIA